MPPYVYFAKGRWFWREYLGNGKSGREIPLAGPKASDQDIWNSYLEKAGTGKPTGMATAGGVLKVPKHRELLRQTKEVCTNFRQVPRHA